MSRQRADALEAVRSGARTSGALAKALGVRNKHASVLLYNMTREGLLRCVGKVPNGKSGPGWLVYEAA